MRITAGALLFWSVAAAAGCSSPDDTATGDAGHDVAHGDADGGADADAGHDTAVDDAYVPPGARLHGTVWGPAPPTGPSLFPISGALVVAYPAPPDEIPDEVYCEQCVALDPGVPNTLSAPDGTFTLAVTPGVHYWLAVQKGQFRRVTEYDAPATDGDVDLEIARTTLPSRTDRSVGDTIPNIAVLYGDYDQIEDLLAKVGIGQDDHAYGYDYTQTDPPFDMYDNGDTAHHGANKHLLLDSLDAMLHYHIIFFNCSYNAIFSFMGDAGMQDRMRQYVAAGGKIYVSDYAMPVVEKPWPDFIWFTRPLQGGCNEAETSPPTCNHGPPFDAPSQAADTGLHDWLDAQGLLTGDSYQTKENWDTIGELFESDMGTDPASGEVVRGMPHVWVQGPWNYSTGDLTDYDVDPTTWDFDTQHPFTVSFQYGCGRVLYTTYHTVGATGGGRHPGLYPQELALFYAIMEIGVCQDFVLI